MSAEYRTSDGLSYALLWRKRQRTAQIITQMVNAQRAMVTRVVKRIEDDGNGTPVGETETGQLAEEGVPPSVGIERERKDPQRDRVGTPGNQGIGTDVVKPDSSRNSDQGIGVEWVAPG